MIQIRNISKPAYSTSQKQIKYSNTMMLFNMIRDLAPISRVDLSRSCSLSVSTVSNLVDELLQKELIVERENIVSGSRGRRAIMLEVNGNHGFVVTVELLSQGYICTIYNICLKKIAGIHIKHEKYDANTIASTINSLIISSKLDGESLLGIHLIFPGTVDQLSGEIVYSTVFPDIEMLNRHLTLLLKNLFPQAQVMISTNGTIIAFEEFIGNSVSPALPLLSVNIDEAIFGGVVMTNPDSNMNLCFPIEIAHSIIDYRADRCTCGNNGCMETLCRTPVLFKTINEKTDLHLDYSELFGSDCNVECMKIIAEALRNNNKSVIKVLQDYVDVLSTALLSTINLMGIQSVHIGGDIAMLGSPFLEMLKKRFNEKLIPLTENKRISFELFDSDYENVRLAATLMCLDVIFKK